MQNNVANTLHQQEKDFYINILYEQKVLIPCLQEGH
jgi:hypothetical protein